MVEELLFVIKISQDKEMYSCVITTPRDVLQISNRNPVSLLHEMQREINYKLIEESIKSQE